MTKIASTALPTLALAALAGALAVCDAGPSAETRFVAEALESRLAAGDIPDFGLLPGEGPIYVVQSAAATEAGYGMTGEQLPSFEGRPVILKTLEELEETAAAGSETVRYVALGAVRREGDVWSVWMGIDYVVAEPHPIGKLCCCSGPARFELQGDEFVFLDWGTLVCA